MNTPTLQPWHLATCTAVDPEHPEITCDRTKDHTGAHHGMHPRGNYATWGLGVCNVVSVVAHAGTRYAMLDDGYFGCCFVEDRGGAQLGQVDWRFHVWGYHIGPTLDVWLCNVRLEYDDEGPWSSAHWDTMYWADDGTRVEDEAVLDGYSDALYPEVREMLYEAMSNG